MESMAEILDLAEAYERELPPSPATLEQPVGTQIAAYIDHTLLRPEATAEQIRALCQEAQQYHFATVCVNPSYIPMVAKLMSGSSIPICTVVGFPLGATLTTQKVIEALICINEGASELDMVMNVGALKGQEYGQVLNEIQAICMLAHNQKAIVKVILETALLTRREMIIACLLCKAAGADFVKTSTGFGPGGATIEDVDLMVRVVETGVKVKAAGGIRDLRSAQAMIGVGAARLGTSASVQIMKEALE